MTKTIQERAKEFALDAHDFDCGNCDTCGKCKEYRKYVDIVTEQKKIDIEKACDWLHLNLPNIEYTIKEPKPLRVSRGLLIDELKKAMDK